MRKRINMESMLQLLIMYGIAILLITAMATGKISYYIHPRLNKTVWFSIVALIFIVIFRIPSIRKQRHNIAYWPYLILLFPMVTAFTLPPAGIKTTVSVGQQATTKVPTKVTQSNESITKGNNNIILQDNQSNSIEMDSEAYTETIVEAEKDVNIKEKYEAIKVDGVYVITDDAFIQWNVDTYDHLEELKGEKFSFLAQVFHIDGLKEDEILFGRMLMICCAADAGVYGVLGETKESSNLEEGAWITVTGTLDRTEYQGEETPILMDVKIESAKQPEDIYVYDFAY